MPWQFLAAHRLLFFQPRMLCFLQQNSLALTGENLTLLQDQGELNRQLHILRVSHPSGIEARVHIWAQRSLMYVPRMKWRARLVANMALFQ